MLAVNSQKHLFVNMIKSMHNLVCMWVWAHMGMGMGVGVGVIN